MPSPSSIARAALVAGVASAASVDLKARQMVTSDCADVHVFLSRGNNEPYPGRQGKLVDAICQGLESCDYEDIQMHNALSDEYCGAISEGTANGVNQVIAYNERCPSSKLVVSGFSQGAHVVGDMFGGGGGTFFQDCQSVATPNLPFNTPAGQAIAAIVTFGDVRHTANQPYNYLDGATKWGLFPRNSQQLANAATFAGVWRDYCAGGDPICAGGDIVDEHLNYFDVYTPEVAEYVHQKLAAAGPAPVPTKSASGPSSTMITAPYPTATHGGNGTSTVITVTNTAGATVTVITTVCPATMSYVPEPTEEVKPPHLTVTVEYPLPEATHSYTAPANGTAPAPTSTSVPPPSSAGSASYIAKMGGVFGAAVVAAAALL
jgi:acetylxylan esterase